MRLVVSPNHYIDEGIDGIGNISDAKTRRTMLRPQQPVVTQMYCGVYQCPKCQKDLEFWQEVGPLTAPQSFCNNCQDDVWYLSRTR